MTVIYPYTKISSIIRADKDSITAISSLSRPLEKLRNPVLRKVMASRVTVAEAAHIGGCSLEDIAAVLRPLGFYLMKGDEETSDDKTGKKPAWLLEALRDKGCAIHIWEVAAGDVRLLIYKK
ncbi:hypothetical protein [Compostibacter hankyongensis]|uniref:DUF1858 domain-containing protein n=1 Tax=Compostibacter hankyongensis TaxID=1007089 RepID=A0ABP8FD40_9BACT